MKKALIIMLICTNVVTAALCCQKPDVVGTTKVEYVAVDQTVYYDIPLQQELQAYTYAMCVKYGIADYYALTLALMQKESNFNAAAISATEDYGLMQINICNHDWLLSSLGLVDIMDPYQNIQAGVYMLSNAIHNTDSIDHALMVYNMGSRGARNLWRDGIDSTSYTKDIIDIYHIILLSQQSQQS